MSSERSLPRLLLTIGDINGIGPEVLLKGLLRLLPSRSFVPAIIGNVRLLRDYVMKLPIDQVSVGETSLDLCGETVPIIDIPSEATLNPGAETAEAGKLAGDAIKRAVAILCDGDAEGMVTMPISKNGMNRGGHHWPGHTEMIAELSGGGTPLMILATEGLRVALMTIHVPLSLVSSLITPALVTQRIQSFHQSLQMDFGVSSPRIALLGVNPHAGEEGTIGLEEQEILLPVIRQLIDEGYRLEGPFPADGFFARFRPGDYDGVLASYHDQGLIPLKMLARGAGVNITAGLPIVRTSPDHGTAFGIAGNGTADESSTVEAIDTALRIIGNRKEYNRREA